MDETILRAWLAALLDAKSSFTVTLLGLAGRLRITPGWKVRLDALPDHLFYFVVKGTFLAEIEGEPCTISAGDLLWVGQGAHLHFQLDRGEDLVVWRFRLSAQSAEAKPLRGPPQSLWHFSPARGAENWMEQIVDETSLSAPFHDERMRALLLGLFTELARAASIPAPQGNVLSRAQRARIGYYLHENSLSQAKNHWPSPAELARAVELSPDYFARCFRRTYGASPRRWLLEERMRLAAVRLVESDATVSQIARELGYENIFVFSRQFKSVMKISPTDYRRQRGAFGA